ncbi:MAG: hypothetical protein M0R33_19660 [Methylomonas sp.]|uniref:hypothetical protein n=1 Tax=Methylomonas sp. TaxID=418 RepID=UPI0025DE2768|nr:hypothetical protein [Methylomonas sp.]MCK9608663.1 hypothetical protein [Methylomonas sp.]
MKTVRFLRWAIIYLSLIICPAYGETDQQHLETFHLEGANEYGGLKKFYEDERAVYYFGALIWKDPQWDKNSFWISTIIALHKPSTVLDTFLEVDRFEAELFSVHKPAFKIRPSEIEYFNAIIFPTLKTQFPSLRSNPPESLQIMGFATGQHFEDSKRYFSSRSRHKIIPEQPLYRLSWFLTERSQYRPAYEMQGQPGADASEFWNSVQEASSERGAIGSKSIVDSISIPQLYRQYESRKKAREEAAEKTRRDAAIAYLNQKRTSGLVYRNSQFWDQFEQADIVRMIFDGEFTRVNDPFEAASIYVGYVDAFNDVCQSFLPSKKASHRTQRYVREGYGPWRKDGEPTVVYMDPLFLPKYEQMLDLAQDGSTLQGLEMIFDVFFSKKYKTPENLFQTILQPAFEIFKREALLRNFLAESVCSSETAKQLGKQLIALTTGQLVPSMKSSPVLAESDPVIDTDIARELALRRHEQEQELMRRAVNPMEGPNGWLLEREDFSAYSVIRNGNEDAYRRNQKYREAVNSLHSRGQPVLQCQYGPTGLNGELPTWRHWIFWYNHVPKEVEIIRSVDGIAQPGLAKAVSECPPTTGAANRLLQE